MFVQLSRNTKEVWVHPMNGLRHEKDEFYQLYPDLRHFPVRFFCVYCMSVNQFDYLLEKLGPKLVKQHSNMREPISAEQQLVLTLRVSCFSIYYHRILAQFYFQTIYLFKYKLCIHTVHNEVHKPEQHITNVSIVITGKVLPTTVNHN